MSTRAYIVSTILKVSVMCTAALYIESKMCVALGGRQQMHWYSRRHEPSYQPGKSVAPAEKKEGRKKAGIALGEGTV